MGKALRSGRQLSSPKGKKTGKIRIVSADDEYAPTTLESLYHPPTDPTYRLGKAPSPVLPKPPKMKARVTKPTARRSKKPATALKAVLAHYSPPATASKPESIIERRPSSIKAKLTSSASSKALSPKKVSFEETIDRQDVISDDEEYASPLGSIPLAPSRFIRCPSATAPPAQEKTPTAPVIKARPASPMAKTPTVSPAKMPQLIEPVQPELTEADWRQMDIEAGELLQDLLANPRPISLNDISACFYHLQAKTRGWAEAHFAFQLKDEEAIEAWPLGLLKTKYRPLFLTTQYIADGSQYGWRRFFTNADSRACLVYGVVGEYVKHHIFGHTAFGFAKEEVVELENYEKENIHQDGFLRNKGRAKMMGRFFYDQEGSKGPNERQKELEEQVDDLVDGLLAVVEPLMPTEIFDYNLHTKQWCVKDDLTSQKTMHFIRSKLTEIIEECVGLHWGIRFRGEDGTVVRIQHHVQKGEQYHEMAPFVCLNKEMMKETEHHGGEKKEKRVAKIKMTCWGRTEAYIPQGRDYDELVEIEQMYRDTHGMLREGHVELEDGEEQEDVKKEEGDKFDWERVDDWYYTYHKKYVRPRAPEEVKRHDMRKHGKAESQVKDFRTPYVQLYRFMSHHDVYCEWEPEDRPEFNFNAKIEEVKEDPKPARSKTTAQREADEKYGVPIPKSERLSLREAVAEARMERHLWRYRREDLQIGFRTHMNRHWWKYESTAWLIGITLYVKSVRGLTWDEVRKMSPGRLCQLASPCIAKFARGTKMVERGVFKDIPSFFATVFGEWSVDGRKLLEKMHRDGARSGWLEYWHTKEIRKRHSWLARAPVTGARTTPKLTATTETRTFVRVMLDTLGMSNAEGQLPPGPKPT